MNASLVRLAGATFALAMAATAAQADVKIGLIYDYTGPFAGGGSKPAAIGTPAGARRPCRNVRFAHRRISASPPIRLAPSVHMLPAVD